MAVSVCVGMKVYKDEVRKGVEIDVCVGMRVYEGGGE